MNIERMKAQTERLRNWDTVNPHVTFDMSQYYNYNVCGTCCCIAGDIALTHGNSIPEWDMHDFAKDYLDLTKAQADWLFLGDFMDEDATPEEAADAIEALIKNPSIGDYA